MESFDSKSYSNYTNNEYGGMYLDENGVLVLCYVEKSNTLKTVQNLSLKASLFRSENALIN